MLASTIIILIFSKFFNIRTLPYKETEAIGIKDLTQQETKESFKIDVAWSEDRYEVNLPWKENCLLLSSNNYLLCESRLRSLHHKLRKDPELLAEYDNIIQDQLSKGIIEQVPNKEKTCRRCDKRHHQSICPRNANSSNNNNNNAQNTERPLNSDRSTQERPRDQTINEREHMTTT